MTLNAPTQIAEEDDENQGANSLVSIGRSKGISSEQVEYLIDLLSEIFQYELRKHFAVVACRSIIQSSDCPNNDLHSAEQ